MTTKKETPKKKISSLTQLCKGNINENQCYDDDGTPFVIREEDPDIEEKLDHLFGKLPSEDAGFASEK